MKNPESAASGWPVAVVAGASMTGVVLMRTLARRGVRVVCFDSDASAPGFRTIYGPAHLCPDFDAESARWAEFVIDLASRLGPRPVLISSADVYVTGIAKYSKELERVYAICGEAAGVQALLATKEKQYSLAAANGFAVPLTHLVASEEDAERFAREAAFPCLLKPLHAREWERAPAGHALRGAKVVVVSSTAELMARYRQARELAPKLVAQETIAGSDSDKLVYISCYGRRGRLGHSLVREVRTMPIHFGAASVVVPFCDQKVEAGCDTFLSTIKYAGLCEIELKTDRRDGCTKMIEANPRFSVTADASQYTGVDVAWLHYLDLAGQSVAPVQPGPGDFRHVVLRRDFATIPSYWRQGLMSWRDLVLSYRPPVHIWDVDFRDWRVTIENLIAALRALSAATLGSLRSH